MGQDFLTIIEEIMKMAKLIQGRIWGTQDFFPFQWKERWKKFAYSYKLVNVLQGKKTITTGVTFISREKSKINI